MSGYKIKHICRWQQQQQQQQQANYTAYKTNLNLLGTYIHSGTMELPKLVVLVSAFLLFTMAMSVEGEQIGVVKIFKRP